MPPATGSRASAASAALVMSLPPCAPTAVAVMMANMIRFEKAMPAKTSKRLLPVLRLAPAVIRGGVVVRAVG